MKILMVNKFLYPKGGTETYMLSLADYLKKKGNEVEFFGMYDEKNIVSNSLNIHVSKIDFQNKSIKTFLNPFRIIYSFQARKKIKKLIQYFKPDIIHINNIHYHITPSIIYEIKKNKIPIIQTLHDYQLICPNHMMYRVKKNKTCESCIEGSYLNCIKNRCIKNSFIKSILGVIEAYLYKFLNVYKHVDQFIAPSNFLANKMIKNKISPHKIEVIHNFITGEVSQEEIKKEDYAIYFGRLTEQKGIKTLVEAFQKIKDLKLLIAGEGHLKNIIPNVGNIEYVGFLQGEQLNDAIKKAKFSIYPSQWYENCPMSILESQMLGTPVIGAKIGGISELINDKVDGLLFEAGNIKDLMNHIRIFYNNDKLIKEYSINCRKKVKQYSLENYYEKLMTLYRVMMSEEEGKGFHV